MSIILSGKAASTISCLGNRVILWNSIIFRQSNFMQIDEQIEGVVIGAIMGFKGGTPLVVFPTNPNDHAIPARALTQLSKADIGCEVALLFEDGKRSRPLIVGRIFDPSKTDETTCVIRDGENVKINANDRIELRCGKSSIIMEADGHITIRGSYLVNHASAANRIRGGSVNIN